MPYTHVSHIPGRSLSDYQAVAEVLGPQTPEGRRALIVGETDGALHIIDVWDSKTHADRFAAERLMPAFRQAGITPGPDEAYIEFDATVLDLDTRPDDIANRLAAISGRQPRKRADMISHAAT